MKISFVLDWFIFLFAQYSHALTDIWIDFCTFDQKDVFHILQQFFYSDVTEFDMHLIYKYITKRRWY